MRQLLVLLFVFSAATSSSIEWTGINTGKQVLVSWTYTPSSITFTVTAQTTGWIGLGFSPTGSMAGADLIIGWVDGSGTGYIKDCYAEANGVPLIDSSQDVTLDSSDETNGATTLMFTRALDTSDTAADNVILTDTTRLLVALSNSDPTDGSSFAYGDVHADKGARSVHLLDPVEPTIVLPGDIQSFEMRASNKTIPHDDDTLYWCTFHKLPTLQQKHHVVQVKPIVEHLDHVHHILVYGCHGLSAAEIEAAGANNHECYTANMPDFAESCTTVILAWAIGGSEFNYPANTGWPIGPDSGAPDYIMMETHYDNPELLQGKIDSSGLEIIYTPTLREYDSAILEVGAVGGILVPPGAEQFTVSGICSGLCTQSMIQVSEGVTVYSYMLHAHLLGAGIRLNLYREGVFHSVLAYDDYYDFNYQATRMFPEPITLLPGDTLEARCTMKSTDRTDLTYGGLRSSDEMCLVFLLYYPKQSAAICRSIPDFNFDSSSALYSNLGVSANTFPESQGIDISNALSGITWDQSSYAAAQEGYDAAKYYQECTGDGAEEYPVHFSDLLEPPVRDTDGSTTPSGAVPLQYTPLALLSVLVFCF